MGGRWDRRHPAGGDPVPGGGGGDLEAVGKTAEALLGPKACWIEHWWAKMGRCFAGPTSPIKDAWWRTAKGPMRA